MKLILAFVISLLLIFAGCVKAGTKEIGTKEKSETEEKTTGIDLGISDSDLQIDDPAVDPTNDNFEIEKP
ncbi:MAG: hypothetical protein QXG02_02715 [Candidatus Anstonellales archaeon]